MEWKRGWLRPSSCDAAKPAFAARRGAERRRRPNWTRRELISVTELREIHKLDD
jgi:hypothetical protein